MSFSTKKPQTYFYTFFERMLVRPEIIVFRIRKYMGIMR